VSEFANQLNIRLRNHKLSLQSRSVVNVVVWVLSFSFSSLSKVYWLLALWVEICGAFVTARAAKCGRFQTTCTKLLRWLVATTWDWSEIGRRKV
jgi:hypothetical protein